jgi:hypothetical protein
MQRVPRPILATIAMLLIVGPVVLLAVGPGGERRPPAPKGGPTLADIARRAGCKLTDFRGGTPTSNPPVAGRYDESVLAAFGSFAGRRPPSPQATLHALIHGAVLFQYRREIGREELKALDRLTREDTQGVILFENQTGMRPRIAATAYLSLMTCPRVDRSTLVALAAFRDRRRAFRRGA